MRLPVSPDVIVAELGACKAIIAKWEKIINEEGVPGIDTPSGGDALDDFLRELCGELRLVGGKCANMSEVIDEGMRS